MYTMKRSNVVLYFVEKKFILDCNVMRVSKLCLFNSNHSVHDVGKNEQEKSFQRFLHLYIFHLWNNISCSLNSIIWMAISSWHDGDTQCTDINTSEEEHSKHCNSSLLQSLIPFTNKIRNCVILCQDTRCVPHNWKGMTLQPG